MVQNIYFKMLLKRKFNIRVSDIINIVYKANSENSKVQSWYTVAAVAPSKEHFPKTFMRRRKSDLTPAFS